MSGLHVLKKLNLYLNIFNYMYYNTCISDTPETFHRFKELMVKQNI